MTDPCDSPYFRIYDFKEGRVLSAADMADIQAVLKEYDEEIEEGVHLFSPPWLHRPLREHSGRTGGSSRDRRPNAARALAGCDA